MVGGEIGNLSIKMWSVYTTPIHIRPQSVFIIVFTKNIHKPCTTNNCLPSKGPHHPHSEVPNEIKRVKNEFIYKRNQTKNTSNSRCATGAIQKGDIIVTEYIDTLFYFLLDWLGEETTSRGISRGRQGGFNLVHSWVLEERIELEIVETKLKAEIDEMSSNPLIC